LPDFEGYLKVTIDVIARHNWMRPVIDFNVCGAFVPACGWKIYRAYPRK